MTIASIPLNSGNEIPQLGFGAFLVDAGEAERVVGEALEIGYRHIDTAAGYHNEEQVGAAVAASGIPRDELFITTKLANPDQGAESAAAAAKESLRKLGLDYVDLYLIHWPVPSKDLYVETWRTLEHLVADGLTRSIGVSNFLPEHLARLRDETDIVPAVNQIELHPLFQQRDVVQASRDLGIHIESWGPIGQGKYDLGELEPIASAAAAHEATAAQITLAWHLHHGYIVFPKSSSPERMRENLAAADIRLTDDEVAAIDALDSGRRLGPDPRDFG